MKDEQIAREIVDAIEIDVGGWDTWGNRPSHGNPDEVRTIIIAALATARRAGFDACKEQALRAVSTLERYSTELERAHAAIRALEPSP